MRRLAALLSLLPAVACGPATPIVNRAAQSLAATVVAGGSDPLPTRTPEPMREPEPLPVQPDGSSVDAIVTAFYASLSHGPEYEPDWNRLRKLFLPAAVFVSPKGAEVEELTALDLATFTDRVRKSIAGRKERGEPLGSTEREISRRRECFGHICQVLSTYETLFAPRDPTPIGRGVYTIQLVSDGRRWWIAALVWDTERADNPIPPEYLPRKSS